MTRLLGPAGRRALARLAADRSLLALDFDGTLAPIVGDRHAAAMRPRTLALLRRVAAAYPCVVVSGRARADVAARLPGVALLEVVGNHGAEAGGAASPAWQGAARGWARALRRAARGLAGVEVEEKGLSVTAHYRHATAPAAARRALLAAARALPGGRVVPGKRVVSVVPAGAPDKGDAVAAAARRQGARQVLFVGDDVTDEDAFGRDLGAPAVDARVGRRRGSRARWYLRDQAEVDALLRLLLELRPSPGEPAPAEGAADAELPGVLGFMRALWELDHALAARSKRMLAEVGVTGPQRLLLRVLGERPGTTPSRLARLLHLDPGSVTRVAARLEAAGLVARAGDPADSRRVLLALTARGRRLDALRAGTVEQGVQQVLARAPAARVREARALLADLAATLHGPPGRPRRAGAARRDGG